MLRPFLFLGLLLFGTVAAADERPVTRDELDGLIHAYLITHPEMIAEMQKILIGRKVKDVLRDNKIALYDDPDNFVLGNPQGDVTLIEFFDNECPFCKLLAPTLDRLIASDHNVRVILKEFAVLGPGSEMAARFAIAARKQGRYPAFHAALMADRTPEHSLAEPHLIEIAKSVGLDPAQLKQDAAAPEVMAQINRNRALGQAIGIVGTPGLVIGDGIQSGAMPYEALAEAVAAARAAKAASAK